MQYNGMAIRALRVATRRTVSGTAKDADIGQPHLSLIEAGKRQPSDAVAMRLAWVLGLDDLRAILVNPTIEPIPVHAPEAECVA